VVIQIQKVEPSFDVSARLTERTYPLRKGFAFKMARMPTLTFVLIWIAILLRLSGCELWTYESW
jgi:hypothetical protein